MIHRGIDPFYGLTEGRPRFHRGFTEGCDPRSGGGSLSQSARTADDHLGMAKVSGSIVAAGLRGSAGNVVFVQTADGTIVRPRIAPHDPQTASQRAARERLTEASRVWKTLTLDQVSAWKQYAASLTNGSSKPPIDPQLVFIRLSVRLLQVNPGAVLPLSPPSQPFPGDAVRIAVSSGSGVVRFSADRVNSPGVVTDLMLQPLASSARASYPAKYRSKRISNFSGGLTESIAVAPGVYACAMRLIQSSDGQAGELLELGRVTVAPAV